MILYLTLIFGLILSYIGYAISNGRADAIKDYRTHIGQHPYRDYWHVMLWVTKFSLIGVGIFDTLLFSFFKNKFIFIIVYNVILVIISILVWNYNYNDPQHNWYKKDESWKISIGIDWIDHLLGIHH